MSIALDERLPKWVRTEALRMENRIEELKRQLETALGQKPKEGCTGILTVEPSGIGGTPIPLQDRAWIRFKLPNGVILAMLRGNGTILDINAERGALKVLPRASNSIHIMLD